MKKKGAWLLFIPPPCPVGSLCQGLENGCSGGSETQMHNPRAVWATPLADAGRLKEILVKGKTAEPVQINTSPGHLSFFMFLSFSLV